MNAKRTYLGRMNTFPCLCTGIVAVAINGSKVSEIFGRELSDHNSGECRSATPIKVTWNRAGANEKFERAGAGVRPIAGALAGVCYLGSGACTGRGVATISRSGLDSEAAAAHDRSSGIPASWRKIRICRINRCFEAPG